MKQLKQYILNRPGFYGMKYNDTLFLVSVAKAVNENENAVVLQKFYMRKKEYTDFQNFIAQGIGGDASVPRMRRCQETIDFKTFEKIFNIKLEDIKKDTAKDLLTKLNNFLQKIVLTRNRAKFTAIDDSKTIGAFNDALDEAFESNQENVDNDEITNDSDLSLRLYNVGQANCSALYGANGLHAVFDLGSKNRKNIKPIKMLTKDTVNTDGSGKPLLFVVSHFHDDHVNLCSHIPAKAYDNAIFVFPYVSREEDINLSLDAQYLIISAFYGGSKIVIMRNSSSNPVVVNGIEFYKGRDCSNGSKGERLNAEGVISYIRLLNKKILLPGDSLYEYWPEKDFDVTHLVLPHHACKNIGSTLKHIKPESIKEVFAFSKFNMNYRHPHTSHTNFFKKVKLFSYFKNEGEYVMFRVINNDNSDKVSSRLEGADEPITFKEVPKNITFIDNSDYHEW